MVSHSTAQNNPPQPAPAPSAATEQRTAPAPAPSGPAQTVTPADNSPAVNAVKQAAKQGFQISATLNVRDNASVEAVLIPPRLTAKVFGKTIGNDYAAIALTISNRSPEAALIVDSIFIDYSHWLLSGGSPTSDNNICAAAKERSGGTPGAASSDEKKRTSDSLGASGSYLAGNQLQPWQTETCPNQIASVEYRIVRDQLQHDQPYTWRNWVIRALEVTGSVATASTFSIGGRHAIQAISAFSGVGIPAARTFLPDDTIGQMDHISDLAFRVNKVIPKESSDIVVAFFPIDRFLTPGFKEWFIKSPALFFAPYAMLLDPKSPQEFKDLMDRLAPGALTLLQDNLEYLASGACDSKDKLEQIIKDEAVSADTIPALRRTCRLGKLLQSASLNSVRIVVGGTMTVNVDNVPAKIDSIEITTTENKPVSWATVPQDLVGIIRGSFLSNGQPTVVNADQLGITNMAAVTEGSTDKELRFKMSLTKPVTQNKLTFKVIKKATNGANLESATYDYQLSTQTPQIRSVDCQTSDKKALVRGPNAPGEVSCVIKGTSLTGATAQIVNADSFGKPTLTLDQSASNDSELHFSMTIQKAVADNLQFRVDKKANDGTTLTSNDLIYVTAGPAEAGKGQAKDKKMNKPAGKQPAVQGKATEAGGKPPKQ